MPPDELVFEKLKLKRVKNVNVLLHFYLWLDHYHHVQLVLILRVNKAAYMDSPTSGVFPKMLFCRGPLGLVGDAQRPVGLLEGVVGKDTALAQSVLYKWQLELGLREQRELIGDSHCGMCHTLWHSKFPRMFHLSLYDVPHGELE